MSNQSIFTFNGHPLKAHYIDNQIWFESKAKQFDKYRKNGLYSLSVVHTHINKRTSAPDSICGIFISPIYDRECD